MRKKYVALIMIASLTMATLFGCSSENGGSNGENSNGSSNSSSGANTSSEAFDIAVNYSEKELFTVNKSDLSQYETVKLSGDTVTINQSGEYVLEGSIDNGQIIVDVPESDTKVVTLILNGVNVKCKDSAALYVKSADKVVLTLVDDTTNTFTDGSSYNYDDAEKEEPNSCIFSKEDLVISGNGKLVVNGNFNNGITTKKDLTITGGEISVTAENHAIKGKDSVAIKTAEITVEAKGDGLKTTNEEEAEKGFILIEDGTFDINAGDDGVQAATCMEIKDGDFEINAGDDGIHAENRLIVHSGTIDVKKSTEGIEAKEIVINDGEIRIVSSDDGFNAAGDDSAITDTETSADRSNGRPNKENPFNEGGSTGTITFNGGNIYVNASGDGLDSNGDININGGYIVVDGPNNGGNGALDYGKSCKMTGGFVVAVGYSQMAQMPNESSVNCVMIGLSKNMQAGEEINITDNNGTTVATYTPAKSFNNIVLCTEALKTGETYYVNVGGAVDTTFTINDTLTTTGNVQGGFGNMGGFGGGKPFDNKFDGERPTGDIPMGERPTGEKPEDYFH